MFGKRRKDDTLTTTGTWALFHKIYLFVTYPFRKPIWCLFLVVVLLGIPTVKGVKFNEIPKWYYGQLEELFSQTKDTVSEKVNELARENVFKPEASGRMADVSAQKPTQRKGFGTVEDGNLETVDILRQEEIVRKEDDPSSLSKEELAMAKFFKNMNLDYLPLPKDVMGIASVRNANEIEIDGIYMFLYGIYANQDTARGIEAGAFLRNLINGKRVKCNIVAYTKQKVATAMCVYNGESINHLMVDEGFSQNISLDLE